MFRKLPLPYKLIFVLSVVSATLAIPAFGIIIGDVIYQDDWREEETASLCRIENLLMGKGTEGCNE